MGFSPMVEGLLKTVAMPQFCFISNPRLEVQEGLAMKAEAGFN